jgi:large conductance mechanosensitive channel
MSQFKDWLRQANLIEVAIGLVIALAIADLVNSLVANLITPLIAAVGGKPDFSALNFTINDSKFFYGKFINALISFLIISLVMFYLAKFAMKLFKSAAAVPNEQTELLKSIDSKIGNLK